MGVNEPCGADLGRHLRDHRHEPVRNLLLKEKRGVPYTLERTYCQRCGAELAQPRLTRAVA
jgi:hypothetical protein